MEQREITAADIDRFVKVARKFVVPVVVVLVVFMGLASSVYQISTDSVGVVLRFGKYVGEVQPGLRFKIE